MRLIDADALTRLLEHKKRLLTDIGGNEHALKAFAYCIKRVHEAPTVEAEPVVHGEWIWKPEDERTMFLACSVCASDKGANELYNYCPNCGAKKDGKSKV